MFEKQSVVMMYAISPVHMGAGTATGLVDNPIQREAHTAHPVFAGSGIKGAVRHSWENLGGRKDEIDAIFGPDPDSKAENKQAGAVSFGDAQLVLFPVRSLKESYVYAASPTTLARARRLLHFAGVSVDWDIPQVAQGQVAMTRQGAEALLDADKLYLEAFEYGPVDAQVDAIAESLAELALNDDDSLSFFREKIADHLVILNDSDFNYFVENSTLVEPHVRIDPDTGTAEGGGLFYSENLPPEAVMIAPLLVSSERKS
ncbi:MAG TPA: type III-B CRISPR module RAMP protein Cmr4, partial [Piscirickettsiaceae bacterium]|nr:type III-B CRISPR module RAMP protein Cmr4 [Piscirickettsiaceae bacterium]